MKKVIAFDLDGTLADSKSPMEDRMATALKQLLENFYVCVISGGKFEQFHKQMLDALHCDERLLGKLHLLPTCGTRYYRYTSGKWHLEYAEDFTSDEKKKIITALNEGIDALGFREKQVYGELVEDRGSQITFSALGQDIVEELGSKGVEIKEAWDPSGEKKLKLRDHVAKLIPEFEVRAGGATSIDVTKPGIDKAYGMEKLMEALGVQKEEILFFGDKLIEGGNDYPVKAMGIDSLEVSHWRDTALALEAINHVV
ncbi:HAD-IIB family hydrolase [Patescibacteria group bacterium]|nr:MAG: HAD-IIB family hydrolase [Patescibacteria group bacterium]